MEIRRQLIEDRCVDVIVSVGTNFFYTVTLPVTLWFLDRGKRGTEREDQVLFIDARDIYRQIDRAHRDWTPEQIEFLANIVRLWRGEEPEFTQGSDALLLEHFPEKRYLNVPGICATATVAEILEQSCSLNPGRYVGVARSCLHEKDFLDEFARLHTEFAKLTDDSAGFAEQISRIGETVLGHD